MKSFEELRVGWGSRLDVWLIGGGGFGACVDCGEVSRTLSFEECCGGRNLFQCQFSCIIRLETLYWELPIRFPVVHLPLELPAKMK